ncbi:MAG: hypothetical protein ACC682_07830 [Gemmatimonadota bacterium]
MNGKRLVIGTLVGGVVLFALGYVIFVLLMGDYYSKQITMPGLERAAPIIWPQLLGTASLAALVTLCLEWSGASSAAQAFKIGAIVGLLAWLGVDLIFYGVTNMITLTQALVDPLLEAVRTGLGAVVIAGTLSKIPGE